MHIIVCMHETLIEAAGLLLRYDHANRTIAIDYLVSYAVWRAWDNR